MEISEKPRAAMSWSSGKDSSLALHLALMSGKYSITTLLTTVNADHDRVSMHGVREELLRSQAVSCGLPLLKVEIPMNSTNEIYENAMQKAIDEIREKGIKYIIFGDIFLEDVRNYRIRMLEGTGIIPVFPLWGNDTGELARQIIGSGIRARVTCLDPNKLDRKFGGSEFDSSFLRELPEGVDPCGENGEYHTFVYSAPFFKRTINVKTGESLLRDGFYFTDLLPE